MSASPKRLVWLTDIHLNFLDERENALFLRGVCARATSDTSFVITGDIEEGLRVIPRMETWKKELTKFGSKLYFVLGNHDFWHGSMKYTRDQLTLKLPECWLPTVGVAEIGPRTAMVGHDGWWDGGYSSFFQSLLEMPEYTCVAEFKYECLNRNHIFEKCVKLATESAEHVFLKGCEALDTGKYDTLYIATHVPPWPESATYRGKISDKHFLPHFSSKVMGDRILDLASKYPQVKFTVLCGHSHGGSCFTPVPNVVCWTGEARYNYPAIANTFIL